MKLPERCWVFLLFFLFISTAEASAINSLKNFIQNTRTVRSVFSQTVLDRSGRAVQKGGGTMQFERPGKFRWIYEKPYEQLIVGDGSRIWFYDRDLNQVTVRKLDVAIGSTPAALLAGNSDIENNFDLTEMGLQGDTEWLEAKPKAKESTFEWVRLGFAPEGALKSMELHDNFGQTTVLTFSRVEQNPRLAPELFKFTPPEGADVISD
ncbi:outer membrane lipoprotein chaperone LolA [Nitrosospira sp. NRS527]|uniref:outer membrane lipoprotein chaperone LolA n=1 Tax=Nitrosospira sp. NRS527 TaxID=155925 RepID=UPI001AF2003D|nr:outer membrane lipoprotein chaperone LolA [Nitrosospira sp. NRS527]BCT66586.1 Outer-membrane lipoprotein carrier protein [Nitrosospira sp. NRS527]